MFLLRLLNSHGALWKVEGDDFCSTTILSFCYFHSQEYILPEIGGVGGDFFALNVD